MRCFQFHNGDKKEEPKTTKSNSAKSSFTDREMRQSGSDCNSQDVSDTSTGSRGRSQFPVLSDRPSNLRAFTFSELKEATKNFNRSTKLGEGGFGCVFKGTVNISEDPANKVDVAIKQLGRRGLQGHKEWVTEVNVLGVVEHPNLVKLIGYCAEDNERGIERLLVYDYMPNGSVEDHLSARSETSLPLAMRLKIAQDAARGLVYLHEEMDFQVVGTLGYAAPEYIQTGRLTSKSDVWSYGVFLYELITGRRPLDRNRPRSEQKLLEWVKPHLSDAKKFQLILDPKLEGKNALKSAHKLSLVANRCLARLPKTRPKMSEVLEMVNKVVEASTGTGNPQPTLRSTESMSTFEETEAKSKRRFTDVKIGDAGWLVRMWSIKLVKTC
ncbi:probable serine/threonine-protein kinase PIX7 isoform X2 [Olea europaea var. sylvestris]|uniref:probable serine/threonine-protein kinase PIX7 isoform X2 n=1 Tax=Olea europaea var. sylvestris TaxID=158386 RepID=UPI000C1D453B|nr:probable serine/threonine-protein kinase PIX7 isoform X2 [Olea europaea var. sylvestris]